MVLLLLDKLSLFITPHRKPNTEHWAYRDAHNRQKPQIVCNTNPKGSVIHGHLLPNEDTLNGSYPRTPGVARLAESLAADSCGEGFLRIPQAASKPFQHIPALFSPATLESYCFLTGQILCPPNSLHQQRMKEIPVTWKESQQELGKLACEHCSIISSVGVSEVTGCSSGHGFIRE